MMTSYLCVVEPLHAGYFLLVVWALSIRAVIFHPLFYILVEDMTPHTIPAGDDAFMLGTPGTFGFFNLEEFNLASWAG